MDNEAVQMFAAPIESSPEGYNGVRRDCFVEHEQSPPNQRTDAAEHYTKLIDRSGRYGRFRHANSLPKPARTVLNLTPWILPLSIVGGIAIVLQKAYNISLLNSQTLPRDE